MKKVVFLGDAPEAYWRRTSWRENVFFGAARDIVVYVRKDSKGWKGKDSTDLPERWPLDGSDSRPIRYINETDAKSLAWVKAGQGVPLVFDGKAREANVEYKFNYNLDANGDAILSGMTCVSPKPVGALVVPAMIDGHKVTRINGNFRDCDQMTSIMFPASLMTFPEWDVYVDAGGMFDRCSSLKNIGIAESNPKYASVAGALYSKDMKTLLAYPKDCSEIRISPTTKVIECAACRTCNVVKFVKVPEGVESIGAGVFAYCANLEVVELPKSLKRIGSFFLGSSPKMKRLVFTGDAPEAIKDKYGDMFIGVSKDLVIEVKKGSKGWNGKDSTDLPKRWPLNSSNSCPIRYID